MGIFSKKDCSICGDKSGLLSNKKLADGNLCKECRAQLSPFYNVTKEDTVAGIAAQLQYREQNLAELDRFRPTIAAGGAGKVFIDPQLGKFTLASEDELRNGNPDLFDLSALRSCSYYSRERIYKGDKETNESDRFEYDFYLKFSMEHPFLRSFSYRYNDRSVSCRGRRIRDEEIQKIYLGQKEMRGGVASFFTGVDRRAMEQYLDMYALGQDMIEALNRAAAGVRSGPVYQQQAPVYQQPVYQQPAAPAYQQPASRASFCPNCGARVEGGAFCPDCGTRL